MKKFTLLTFVFSLFLIFTVFAQKGYVNPAAKYCEMLGYRYEITSVKGGGDIGMVHLPDGSIQNAWDFYKGKVAQEFSYAALHGFDIETETVKENGYVTERAVCVRNNKGTEERIPLLDLMEMNGDQLMTNENRSLSETHTDAKVDPNFSVSKALPTSFDWRNYNGNSYIGSPRDQGSCGSCYAFGATAAAEGTYNYATGKYGTSTADFSESYIAWCLSAMSAYSSHFSGCNGADYTYSELQALVDIGTVNESYFPYVTTATQSCPSAATNAPKTKFNSWNRVACSDIDAIKTAIMTYGVVDAAVYVSDAFSAYSGGIFSDASTACATSPCYNTPTNHAIALVGWGYDATYGDYWILRNSWGSSWGESGYMRIDATSARVACSVCYMTYAGTADTQAPTAPTNLVSSNITSTSATISWTASTDNVGVTGYDVYQNSTLKGSTTSTSYNVTGLTAATTYSFTVKAKDAAGNVSAASTAKSVTTLASTDTQAPTAPTNLASASIAQTTFTLSWTASTDNVGVTGYDIYKAGVLLASTTSTSYNVTGLIAATTYSFTVKAKDAVGNVSAASTALSVTTLSSIVNYCTSLGSNYSYEWISKVVIGTFTNSSTAAGYTDFTSKVITLSAGTSYSVSLTPGFSSSSYNEYWKIWIDYNGDKDFEDANELAFDGGALLSTVETGTLAVLSTATGTTRMRVSMKYNAAQTSCETFSYGEVEDYTVTFGTVIPDTQAPTAPTSLVSSNITSSSATISWTASTDNIGVTGYDVYQNGTLKGSATSTSYNVTGLTANTTYSFTVKAKDAAGNVSAASTAKSVTTLPIIITYCASKGTNYTYEWIDYVAMGGMTNTTAANAGYGNFTATKTATVALGASTTISYSAGFKSTSYTEYWRVWIDWNQNGTFETTELVASKTSSLATTLSSTFTVPTTALIGATRMRVSMKYNAAQTSACETFSYGEVEDYTVNVTGNTFVKTDVIGDDFADEAPTSLLVYPNPASNFITVGVSNGTRVGTVSIYNLSGVLVKVADINGEEKEINISDLSAGTYIISVQDEKETLKSKIVKQ